MNGTTLYTLRDLMNLNEKDFGEMFGLTGENVKQSIHAMETGRKAISGPLKELIPRIAAEHGYALHNSQWTRIGDKT